MVTYTEGIHGFWCKYILEFKFNVIFNIHFDDPWFRANLECSLTRINDISTNNIFEILQIIYFYNLLFLSLSDKVKFPPRISPSKQK